MFANSRVYCTACGSGRDCSLHLRAEHPPTAAEAWLRKHCDHNDEGCTIRYQAGLTFGLSRLTGQGATIDATVD